MKNIKTSIAIVVTLVVVFGVFAYVGNGFKRATPTPGQPTSQQSADTGTQDVINILLSVVDEDLGNYVADPQGAPLYRTTRESCEGECLVAWPPYLAPGSISFGDIGTVPFGDVGEFQYTWKGEALYYFAEDAVSGGVNGHEKGGVWFLARP